MDILGLLALLIALLIPTAYSCPEHHLTNTSHLQPGHPLVRRWYGVPSLPLAGPVQSPYYYPWPVTCGYPNALQPLRYCFRDKRSADNLEEPVNLAIAYWAEAMRVSAMKIILDPGAENDIHNYCGTGNVAHDAYWISDVTIDGDYEWNSGPRCRTASTLGYHYIPPNQFAPPRRHHMIVCAFQPDWSGGTKEMAAASIAHEFGHGLGLSHEHQRPDRDSYLDFHCKNLRGYADAEAAAIRDVQRVFTSDPYDSADEDQDEPELTTAQRMALVCTNDFFGARYLPMALQYTARSRINDYNDMATYGENSVAFDYESIMIYGSYMGTASIEGRPAFTRKDNGGLIAMGGNPDKTLAKVSRGDVARIAMLYPSDTQENQDAIRGIGWETATRLKIRGVEVAVKEGSLRKRDEL